MGNYHPTLIPAIVLVVNGLNVEAIPLRAIETVLMAFAPRQKVII